jgi:cob(I)alamin adenosyltransferase
VLNVKGYVQVYTGDGKGKTTAAIGLCIRALGANKKVMFLQFMKEETYSEHSLLRHLSKHLVLETIGKPYFVIKSDALSKNDISKLSNCVVFEPGNPPEEYVLLVETGVEKARLAASSGQYDLVVLDEINCALYFELTTWGKINEIIKTKAPTTELVLTGRGAPLELLEAVDLVTEMKEIKHYYTQGVMARKGIEN